MILLYAAEENPNMVSKFFLAFHEIHSILAIHVFNLEVKEIYQILVLWRTKTVSILKKATLLHDLTQVY